MVEPVDGDHIEGCLKLLNHPELATFQDIWFNGWPHIAQELKEPPPAPRRAPSDEAASHQRSAMQGTEISVRIDGRQWNAAFEGSPVFVPATGALPVRELPGGLRLTLLSPTLDKLVKLRTAWSRALERAEVDPANEAALRARLDGRAAYRASGARLRPTPDQMMSSAALALGPMDDAVANGSSIAVIAEYAGRRLALLGDAHAPTLAATLGRMAAATGAATLRLDAVKLAHHGSAANLSPELLGRIECGTWLVSTDGSLFQHPDDEAIHAVVRQVPGARLLFNYRSARTAPWDEPAMRAAHGHQAFYPRDPAAGIALDLMTGEPG